MIKDTNKIHRLNISRIHINTTSFKLEIVPFNFYLNGGEPGSWDTEKIGVLFHKILAKDRIEDLLYLSVVHKAKTNSNKLQSPRSASTVQ